MTRRTFQHFGLLLFPVTYGAGLLGASLRFLAPLPAGRREKELEVGERSEFGPDQDPVRVEFNGSVVYVLNDGVKLRAFDAKCPHFGCNVNWPQATDPDFDDYKGTFRCPCHNAGFDRQGRWFRMPANENLTEFAVIEAGGKVIVLDKKIS